MNWHIHYMRKYFQSCSPETFTPQPVPPHIQTLFIQQALWKKAGIAMILILQISKEFIIIWGSSFLYFCLLWMYTWVCPDTLQKMTPILLKNSMQRVKCSFPHQVPIIWEGSVEHKFRSWLAVLPSQHRTQPKTCFKKNRAGMEIMDSLGMPSVF